ncbi:UPF0102 protein YraN [hydrothermal vent metagenome]|uniref:UPF0102 protein YraN n=1 Tax=hydrothermal vent metagenome TaxID=652676 RepID=A0A3B1B5V5_9ZZZZ
MACEYLQAQGLHLLERNFRVVQGEIDLIMEDRRSLIFVEVRFRRNNNFGTGAETINQSKQRKLLTAAACYLQRYPRQAERPARFDVVSMMLENSRYSINWIKNAFQANI